MKDTKGLLKNKIIPMFIDGFGKEIIEFAYFLQFWHSFLRQSTRFFRTKTVDENLKSGSDNRSKG
ncbi:hypothetical protein B6A10_05695 [Flavobacterium sp. L1I52]|uniref:Uncharacterized protein n=1 Tax=Flavobacterium pokkalii TaxID=1940408 RepID=A0ABR7UP63_9FLAO|nr:hypothetical protein [Flavobacterium pokkalii]